VQASTQTELKLVSAVAPLPEPLGAAVGLVSWLMHSAEVLYPKIDRTDGIIIAFKQHKTPVVQPVAGRR